MELEVKKMIGLDPFLLTGNNIHQYKVSFLKLKLQLM